MIKNVKRMKRQLEKEKMFEEAAHYDFCPTTFVLPGDYALFKGRYFRIDTLLHSPSSIYTIYCAYIHTRLNLSHMIDFLLQRNLKSPQVMYGL
jgi:hypothetical protein